MSAASQLALPDPLRAQVEAQLRAYGIVEGDPIALRVCSPRTQSVVVSSIDDAVRLARITGVEAVYLVGNPVRSDFPRSKTWHGGATVTDDDVTSRRVLAIDLDPTRRDADGKVLAGKVSATDDEAARAAAVARRIRNAIDPLDEFTCLVASGSGTHVQIRLADLPNDAETKALCGDLLAGLQAAFGTDDVVVDPTMKNAARILPLCGTTKRKGKPTAERPHRLVTIDAAPSLEPLTLDGLKALVAKYPAPSEPASRAKAVAGPWAAANAIAPAAVGTWLGLDPKDPICPGCGCGGAGDTSVLWLDHGLYCHHARCASKGKDGLRSNVDLVAEVRGVTPARAVELIAQRFAQAPANDAAPMFATIGVDDVFAELPPVPWLCEGLGLAPGAISLLGGYGFAGKTMAAQALAMAVMAGRPAWGAFPIAKPGRVVHLDWEQGARITSERYQRLAYGMGVQAEEIRGQLALASFPRGYVDTLGAIDELRRLVEGASLVIVDSLRAAMPSVDENDSKVRTYLDLLSRLSEETGATVLVIHHARKNDETGGARLLRGSGAIFDAAQTVYTMAAEKGEPATVSLVKDRLRGTPTEDFSLRVEDVEGRAGLRVEVTEGTGPKLSPNERKVLDFLRARDGEFGGSKTQLAQAMGGKTSAMHSAIASLASAGLIVIDGSLSVRLA